MGNLDGRRELAELLGELKERSGRSYEQISRRAHLSKSSVHRYCSGRTVTGDFGTVERIARVCGARPDDLARLFRVWERAVAASDPDGPAGAGPPPGPDRPDAGTPDGDGAGGEAPQAPPTSRPWPRVPRTPTLVKAMVLVALCASVLTAGAHRTSSTANPAAQTVSGPAWVLPPVPVPSTFFGVTVNSATGAMPGFRVGAVRLWDSGTRWAQLEPDRGRFDWWTLDRLVSGARTAGLPALFVLGGTPAWASPAGAAAPYPDGSRSAPPDDLREWDAFVRALVDRYRGRIEAYEVWALGNDPRFYSGSVESLVELTRRASRIIRAGDRAATVVCPGMGRLSTVEGQQFLRRFAELGGYRWCDVASVKLHQKSAADPPETMLALVRTIDRIFHETGVHPRLWNTGTTYSIPLQGSLDGPTARAYAVRFYLVGLYARAANLERFYFYNWGGTKIPVVLQAVGGQPTEAALAVEQLQRWLARARISSCGQGRQIGLPDNVWRCSFTVDAGTATILWASTGTATVSSGPGRTAVHHLDGTVATLRPGDPLRVGPEPLLVAPAPAA